MSPLSSIPTGYRLAIKYTNDLFALFYGVKWRCARTWDLLFLIAINSALRLTGDGASKTSRGSWTAGVTRLNARKSAGTCAAPNSACTYMCHSACACVSRHPLLPCCSIVLLTYIQLDLSTTFCVWAAGVLPGGLAAGGCVGGVCVTVWVGLLKIDWVVGTAIVGVFIGLASCVLVIPVVGLPFGDGGACIVATTSAQVSFAGVFLVAYNAT